MELEFKLTCRSALRVTLSPCTVNYQVARGVLDYMRRDMTHPEGGLFCAEDAESFEEEEGKGVKAEGAFYIWRASEVRIYELTLPSARNSGFSCAQQQIDSKLSEKQASMKWIIVFAGTKVARAKLVCLSVGCVTLCWFDSVLTTCFANNGSFWKFSMQQ